MEQAAGKGRAADAASSRVQIRLLGGLSVHVDGEPVPLPSGAPAMATALLALRRTVHVEELVEVLWPEAPAEVGRRRLRNVLSRIRSVVGPVVVRHGEAVALARDVWVDHEELDAQARAALALPPGPERRTALSYALSLDGGPLLPEAVYEEWTDEARADAEARRERLRAALADSGH